MCILTDMALIYIAFFLLIQAGAGHMYVQGRQKTNLKIAAGVVFLSNAARIASSILFCTGVHRIQKWDHVTQNNKSCDTRRVNHVTVKISSCDTRDCVTQHGLAVH